MATEESMDWAMATEALVACDMAMEVSVATATTIVASMVWAMALAVEVATSIDWATILALEAVDMVLAMGTKDMATSIPPLLGDMASPTSTEE